MKLIILYKKGLPDLILPVSYMWGLTVVTNSLLRIPLSDSTAKKIIYIDDKIELVIMKISLKL